MPGKAGSEQLAEGRHKIGRVDDAVRTEAQHGIGAVQGKPAAAASQECAESRHLRIVGGHEIACVGDQHIRARQIGEIGIVGRNRRTDLWLFRQQFEQFEPRKINVVKFSGGDQMNVQDSKLPSPAYVRVRASLGQPKEMAMIETGQ